MPALAAVDAAGIVLWLVVAAQRAAHPELRDGDPDPRSRTKVWLAQAVIALTRPGRRPALSDPLTNATVRRRGRGPSRRGDGRSRRVRPLTHATTRRHTPRGPSCMWWHRATTVMSITQPVYDALNKPAR